MLLPETTSITINLPEGLLKLLHQRAQELGITPEELIRMSIEQLIVQPSEVKQATEHVLQKNAALYRCLA